MPAALPGWPKPGIVVALEFHGGTITDTNETTLRLADVAEQT